MQVTKWFQLYTVGHSSYHSCLALQDDIPILTKDSWKFKLDIKLYYKVIDQNAVFYKHLTFIKYCLLTQNTKFGNFVIKILHYPIIDYIIIISLII